MRTKGHAVNSKQNREDIMLIQRKAVACRLCPPAPGARDGAGQPGTSGRPPAGHGGRVFLPQCSWPGARAGTPHRATQRPSGHRPAGSAVTQAGSLVRVPRPDYSSPASVAAAFYVAWGSTDAIHDGPDAYAARCAPLVTAALERQLTSGQPATAAWQALRRDQTVSLVRVRAVIRPAGAPAPTSQVVYLRVYATRVTTSTTGRTVSSDGITLRLARSGGRWLVSAVLFY